MAMQQCPNGHIYDDAKNSKCPWCGTGNSMNVTDKYESNHTPDNIYPDGGGFRPTEQREDGMQPTGEVGSFPKTTPIGPVNGGTMPIDDYSGGTHPIDPVKYAEIREIRGWLVCVEGERKGADFRICGGRNTIGRGVQNDIVLDFDNTISVGSNAGISYDDRNNKFFIYYDEARNNIYVNNQLLMTPIELKDYDVIEIGRCKLVFRSFCNENFNWEKKTSRED